MLPLYIFLSTSMAAPSSVFPIAEDSIDAPSSINTYTAFPSTTVALQENATTLWTNPANFAFVPALTKSFSYHNQAGQRSLAFSKQLGILGYGVFHNQHPTLGSWWSASSALALKLDKHLSISTTSTWHSIEALDDTFVRWDIGSSWRPLPWLGFGGSIHNIGSPEGLQHIHREKLSLIASENQRNGYATFDRKRKVTKLNIQRSWINKILLNVLKSFSLPIMVVIFFLTLSKQILIKPIQAEIKT